MSPEIDEPQRSWDNLLSNRILVYCERHPIIPELGTPARNHAKFPGESKQSSHENVLKSKAQSREQASTLTRLFTQALKPSSQNNMVNTKVHIGEKASKSAKLSHLKKRDRASLENAVMASQNTAKLLKHITGERLKPSFLKLDRNALPREGLMPKATKSKPPAVFMIKSNAKLEVATEGNANVRSSLTNQDVCNTKDNVEKGSKHKLMCSVKVSSFPDAKQRMREMSSKTQRPARHQLPQKSPFLEGNMATLDNQARNFVSDIIERAKTSISLEDVMRKHEVPACYKRSTTGVDRKYAMEKVESIVKGVRKAFKIFKSGGMVEDAKANCSPDFLDFVQACQKDLNVYLCPFLHGNRYTSFGWHFTIPQKLAEIVERLHWYVQEGDMLVDFCCGSNHFSLMMKQKLEETWKSCDYKNFDLFTTNNDFNFTKGDWFDVKQDQLPDGNRLVMGLNPPFALANQFVRHALKFKPKLLVLIVPKETERPGQRHGLYDLIWEDNVLLSGKSFHLPGSIDVDDQTLEDWNTTAPFLYIWSRPDWAGRHHAIALDKGHVTHCSNSSYVGSQLHKTSLQIPSLSDFGLEEDEENMAGDMRNLDQNKTDVESIIVKATLNGRKSGENQENISLMPDKKTEPTIVNLTLNGHEACGNEGDINLMSDGHTEPLECNDVGFTKEALSAPQDQNIGLAEKDHVPKGRWSEACGNLPSGRMDNARHELLKRAMPNFESNNDGNGCRQGRKNNELLERAMPNFEFNNDGNVCTQERENNARVEEPVVLVDRNNQPKRALDDPSMEANKAKEILMILDTLVLDVRKLPNNYYEQRQAPERASPNSMMSGHRGILAENLFDGSVSKNTHGCDLAFERCAQASEHPRDSQSNWVFPQANRPSKVLYRPQQGPISMWKQDTQNSRGYSDTHIAMQKRQTQYNRPEAPRGMLWLQEPKNSNGQGGFLPRTQGFSGGVGKHLHNGLQPGPRDGVVGAFPHNGLQSSQTWCQAPHSYSPRAWTGMPRPGVVPAQPSCFPEYRATSGLHDPSRLTTSHNNFMLREHPAPLQGSSLGCPSGQRLPGQAQRRTF
ncbi:hypothetical protein GOP47_0019276 [Adiantum capillus-veneris]|uniref:DM2 domain-containing protein n=1 Tax=Adiantum capillus-veneris TaxID=13818 RepID=A0A9D4ZAC8_ADICA|nr:hypothetical protein GOP47_0019276 [Adiantum capillus-veneris]